MLSSGIDYLEKPEPRPVGTKNTKFEALVNVTLGDLRLPVNFTRRMIRGYVSSDEDEDDFYSDPVVRRSPSPTLPRIQTKKVEDELTSAMELSKKISLFFKAIEDDYSGDKIHMLEKLITLGVSVNGSFDEQRWTPLMKAASLGKCEVVEFLLQNEANPNQHKELFTALMACCTETCIPEDLKLGCVNHLIQYGAKVNLRDKYHTTALMYASGSQYESIVEKLLTCPGIEVNLQDKEGATALFYAVLNNNLQIVQKLIDAEIDITICDRNERTALDVALLKEYYDVAKLLGYIEPVVDFEVVKNKDPVAESLLDLPSSSGDGGFCSDVKLLLDSLATFPPDSNYSERGDISLPEFLNSTEAELKEMGILFDYDRQRVLKCTIHQFHLAPWKRASMPKISNDDFGLYEALDIMSAMVKHLTLMVASLKYLRGRITRRKIRQKQCVDTENDLLYTLALIYDGVESLKDKLKKIQNHSDQIEICVPEDFITSSSENQRKSRGTHGRKILCGVAVAFGVWFLYKSQRMITI